MDIISPLLPHSAAGVDADLTELIVGVRSIADQPACLHMPACPIHRRQRLACRQSSEKIDMVPERSARRDQEALDVRLCQPGKNSFDVVSRGRDTEHFQYP